MTHRKYNKIYALGKEEVEGILEGEVIIQEKIDGANSSTWIKENIMKFGSRNQEVQIFNGFPEYCKSHEGIKQLLSDFPNYRLFGEWLVRHTLPYNPLNYNHFYLFDIVDESTNEWLRPEVVSEIADSYNIRKPQVFFQGVVSDIKDVQDLWVGKSELGDRGEGVVIKNHNFVSKFGIKPQYAKIVTQDFKENNAITFGGNNKSSDTYWEQYICNEFMTTPRVMKIIQKIESITDKKVSLSDTSRITMSAYNDMLTEEIWTIQKKVYKVNFKDLSRICTKKAQQIFKDILAEDLSIVDNKEV